MRRRTAEKTPLDGVDVLLVDLDGVVYKGADAIPYAVESLNRARDAIRVGYVTNNASRTPDVVAQQLTSFGVEVRADDVVTSPQAAARVLADMVPAGSLIHVVGGEGLVVALEGAGFSVTRSADDASAAVVQGFAPRVGWEDLAEATFALHRGIPWIATNMDWTIPLARGVAPGNGTLVSAVHTAVGRLPRVVGKPETPIFDEARRRFDSVSALFVGDRLDTDILGARRAGIASALVLTGIDSGKHLLAADVSCRPKYIFGDLRDLHVPYPATRLSRGGAVAAVGASKVQLRGRIVEIDDRGSCVLDLLRACCAVVWGSGRPIHGLDVSVCLDALGISRE